MNDKVREVPDLLKLTIKASFKCYYGWFNCGIIALIGAKCFGLIWAFVNCEEMCLATKHEKNFIKQSMVIKKTPKRTYLSIYHPECTTQQGPSKQAQIWHTARKEYKGRHEQGTQGSQRRQ